MRKINIINKIQIKKLIINNNILIIKVGISTLINKIKEFNKHNNSNIYKY